jgi:hypothetical protein
MLSETEVSRHEGLPDFIIGGAMKAGTSSLHHVLGAHDDIYIAPDELFFFDLDEFQQHPGLFLKLQDRWVGHDYRADFDENFDWYVSQFEGAAEGQLLGEDSTSYLSSRKAPRRMRELLPDVKLIFLLRDPVDRLYSHYWYNLLAGWTTEDFRTYLNHIPWKAYEQSCYVAGLKRYYDHFDRQQVHPVIFEEFVESPQKVVDDICQFLELEESLYVSTDET